MKKYDSFGTMRVRKGLTQLLRLRKIIFERNLFVNNFVTNIFFSFSIIIN